MTSIDKRWNVMLLVAEDTGRHQGCYGATPDVTPHINQLAREGVRYTNAFSTAPVCAPSRHTLFTGQYAWSTGAHHMRSHLLEPPKLLTEELREAGYYVNWANKTDLNFPPPENFADDQYDWIDDLAAGKLPSDQPWFLYFNAIITHESCMWEDHWEKWRVPNFEPGELTDPACVEVPPYLPDTPTVRAEIARYFDSLCLQDRTVGRALQALEQSGQADRTIVIYLADHGRGLVREKRWLYPAGIHLPLIIRWPGALDPGTTSDDLVSWVDFAPTLHAMLGLEIPERYQGRAFLGAVTTPAREYCFAGRDRMDDAYDCTRCVRDARFHYLRNDFPELPYAQRIKYMEIQASTRELRALHAAGQTNTDQALWMAEQKPAEELYDVRVDPHCLNNLASDPAYAEVLTARRAALADLRAKFGDYGLRPERELIEQGLVKDVLTDEYRSRIAPLPPEQQLGLPLTQLEMPEA